MYSTCTSKDNFSLLWRKFDQNYIKITLHYLKAWIARHRVIESRFGRFVILMVVIKYKHMSKYNFGWRFQKSWFRLDSFKSIEVVLFVSSLRNRITTGNYNKGGNPPFNDKKHKKGEICSLTIRKKKGGNPPKRRNFFISKRSS